MTEVLPFVLDDLLYKIGSKFTPSIIGFEEAEEFIATGNFPNKWTRWFIPEKADSCDANLEVTDNNDDQNSVKRTRNNEFHDCLDFKRPRSFR
jgi:hypothetical protein